MQKRKNLALGKISIPFASEDEGDFNDIQQTGNSIYYFNDVDAGSIADLCVRIRKLEASLLTQAYSLGIDPIPLHLYINSLGGDVYAGLAGAATISRCKVPVHTHVIGCAASAATLLALAGHHRTIAPQSFMLLHQISSEYWGTHEFLKDQAANDQLIMDTFVEFYKNRTKMSVAEIQSLLKRDLLFDALTCLEKGIVDEID